jgi:rfaE bifunctional protein kinase chain/domain
VEALLARMAEARVVVLGDVMLDAYVSGSVDRISPEAPVPVIRVTGESVRLGGAANVACNIAALGGKPFLVGVIGADESGKELKQRLSDAGLARDGLVVDGSRPTTRKTRVVASRQQVVRVDRESGEEISPETAAEVLRVVEQSISSADALLIQDYNKGLLPPPVIRQAVARAREAGVIVTVDPKFHNFFEYVDVTLFKPNVRELVHALGSLPAAARDLERVMRTLKERIRCRYLLLTRGEEGMSLLDDGGGMTTIPAIGRDVFDVSGAGDTVISTITLALAAGAGALEGAILANHAAGVGVRRSGVSTVTPAEILEDMRRHGGIVE